MNWKKEKLVYLSLFVVLFALFLFSFYNYANAEQICDKRVNKLIQAIEEDECLGECLNPNIGFNISIEEEFLNGFKTKNNS